MVSSDRDQTHLANAISHPSNRHAQWFLDANLFIAPTDATLWDALFRQDSQTIIAEPIFNEIKQWTEDPKHNPNIANHLKATLSKRKKIGSPFLFTIPKNDSTICNAINYYTNLLGLRKKGAEIIANWLADTHNEHNPSAQRISNLIKDKFGQRAQLVARSGFNTKTASNKYNDEAMIVMAVFDALKSGTETAIITRDEGLYEQFYKFLWLLDTHYRATLLADAYGSSPLEFATRRHRCDEESSAFKGEVVLIKKPSDSLEEVLPCEFESVPIHCFHIGKQLSHTSFMAERHMLRTLDIKGRTGGLSTDQFPGANCHIYLPHTDFDISYAAIGHDVSHATSNSKWKISLTDANICLVDCEPSKAIREVDPRLILLPDNYH